MAFDLRLFDRGDTTGTYFHNAHFKYHVPKIVEFREALKSFIERHLECEKAGSNFIQLRTSSSMALHDSLKKIFDYLGCFYILSRLRENGTVLKLLPQDQTDNYQNNYTIRSHDEMTIKICLMVELVKPKTDHCVFVRKVIRMDEQFDQAVQLGDRLKKTSCHNLRLKLECQERSFTKIFSIYQAFFQFKVATKFYCWPYVKNFMIMFNAHIFFR